MVVVVVGVLILEVVEATVEIETIEVVVVVEK